MNSEDFYTIIQLMLAPAVMISACGLLLLGITNKHTSITNRIRLLNEEKRRLLIKMRDDKQLEYIETIRLQSILKQLDDLIVRLRLVRNVIIFYSTGILLFVGSSLFIGIEFLVKTKFFDYMKIITFVLGMLSVAIGLINALLETIKGYKVVLLDIKADE
jgi:uncharacterized membrane protein YgdD (TMEM256/DUF423 family)